MSLLVWHCCSEASTALPADLNKSCLTPVSPHRRVPRQKLLEGHRPVDAVDRLGQERGDAEFSDLGAAGPILDLAGGSPRQTAQGMQQQRSMFRPSRSEAVRPVVKACSTTKRRRKRMFWCSWHACVCVAFLTKNKSSSQNKKTKKRFPT